MRARLPSWVPVYGYEGYYEISISGQVRRVKGGRGAVLGKLLASSIDSSGYTRYALHKGNKQRCIRLSILMLESFVGPRPPGLDCCHRDGDRQNDSVENLYWGTRSDNMEDARRHGTLRQGEACHFSKLTDRMVLGIRSEVAAGANMTRVACKYGMSRPAVSAICNRKTWTHI